MSKRKTIRQELDDLKSLIGQLKVSTPKQTANPNRQRSRSRGRARSRSRVTPATYPALAGTSANSITLNNARGRSRNRQNNNNAFPLGTCRIKARELCLTAKLAASTTDLPHVLMCSVNDWKDRVSYAPPQLKMMAALYDEWRPISWVYEYEPVCSVTLSGSVIMAAYAGDDKQSVDLSETIIAACNPNVTSRVYEPCRISIPVPFMRNKNWYRVGDNTANIDTKEIPALGLFFATGTSGTSEVPLGRIWCRYEVEFQGFAPV